MIDGNVIVIMTNGHVFQVKVEAKNDKWLAIRQAQVLKTLDRDHSITKHKIAHVITKKVNPDTMPHYNAEFIEETRKIKLR